MTNYLGSDIHHYHILEQIGQGGMATVFKAYDTRLERLIAIKIIRKEAFGTDVVERILQRFNREAKALSKLTHANIVPIIDNGEQDGTPFLVMPFILGGTLKQRISGSPLPLDSIKHWILPIARALGYAHSRGILHRDVKPSNILLTESNDPLLADFGVAKILEFEEGATLTGVGMGMGTPEYMAPEQWVGNASPASDQYSLGVILYELATGKKPYTADTPAAVLLKHVNDPLPRPSLLAPHLPEDLEYVLLKALAKQPENRYPHMAAFEQALSGTGQVHPPSKQRRRTAAPAPDDRTIDLLPQPADASLDLRHAAPAPSASKRSRSRLLLWLTGVFLAVSAVAIIFLVSQDKLPEAAIAAPTSDGLPSDATRTITPSMTATPDPTLTPTPQPTPVPQAGATMISPVDGMVLLYVPEGSFIMGSNSGDFNTVDLSDVYPEHEVFLDAFWIDRTEVTNEKYALCVADKGCNPPASNASYSIDNYYDNPEYANFPVVYVSWYDAQSYCKWAGRQLPSEAQWEKAARGTDGRLYPWGNDSPNCTLANYHSVNGYCQKNTMAVDSHTSGASPYGALDMAGNVSEWVADWYGANYYRESPRDNPLGPENGVNRVVRGGSWEGLILSTYRNVIEPSRLLWDRGFRCALTP